MRCERSAILLQVFQIIFAGLSSNFFAEGKRKTLLRRDKHTCIPYKRFPEYGVSYKIFDNPLRWQEALAHCIIEDGVLAIIDTKEKVHTINKLRGPEDKNEILHVGISWSDPHEDWIRANDNVPLESIPWAKGKPNDSGNCVGIDANVTGTEDDGLVNYNCHIGWHSFVCEIY